jgi:hypothetical protein
MSDLPGLRTTVRFQYFPECEYLVRRCMPNAARAVAYDWRQSALKPSWSSEGNAAGAHLLQSILGAEEAMEWIGRRWGVVRVLRILDAQGGSHVRLSIENNGSDWIEQQSESGFGGSSRVLLDVRVLTLFPQAGDLDLSFVCA